MSRELPAIDEFESFLAGLRADRPTNEEGWEELELFPAEFLSEENGRPRIASPLVCWLPSGLKLRPVSFFGRLAKAIEEKRHPCTEPILRALLGVWLMLAKKKASAVEDFNEFLANIRKGEISQWWIARFPPPPGFRSFRLGSFQIGQINLERLEYRCRRSRTDYFDRYGASLRGRFCVEQDHHQSIALDSLALTSERSSPSPDRHADAITAYFSLLSAEHRKEFHLRLREEQEILAAAGAPVISLEKIPDGLASTHLCLYQDIGSDRFAFMAPTQSRLGLDFVAMDRRVPAAQQRLQSNFAFDSPGDDEIGHTLRSYCRFVTTARLLKDENRISESFLHFVIALDLLLGSKGESTRSVSQRAAALCFGTVGAEFAVMVKEIEYLYDARSRYVHEGVDVQTESLARVELVVAPILDALLRLHQRVRNGAVFEVPVWHERLDFVAAALKAEKCVQVVDWQEIGVLPPAENR